MHVNIEKRNTDASNLIRRLVTTHLSLIQDLYNNKNTIQESTGTVKKELSYTAIYENNYTAICPYFSTIDINVKIHANLTGRILKQSCFNLTNRVIDRVILFFFTL